MSQIVVLGSLNMDLVVQAKRLPVGGETILGEAFHEIAGGKGANQAVAMARLGASVKMIGRVGKDGFGNTLMSTLNKDGIDTTGIKTIDGISTGVALITLQSSGENSIIVVPGANGKLMPEDLEEVKEDIMQAETFVTQLETPIQTVKAALKIAKKGGAFTILNPAPAQFLDQEILENVDLLTPNETELALLSGLPTTNLEEVTLAAKALMKQGVKTLVVTLGSEGALYLNVAGAVVKQDAFKVVPVDTTAAGDSFTGGLAVALTNDKAIEEALVFASQVGALTVQKLGAQSSLPYLAEVEKFGGKS
jgi:ribokinase